jgi:hypothetical protein
VVSGFFSNVLIHTFSIFTKKKEAKKKSNNSSRFNNYLLKTKLKALPLAEIVAGSIST